MKTFHYVIEVDEKNNITLASDGDAMRFNDGNVFNEETEEWEKGYSNENEERDLELVAHLTNVFNNHNEIFGDGEELSGD